MFILNVFYFSWGQSDENSHQFTCSWRLLSCIAAPYYSMFVKVNFSLTSPLWSSWNCICVWKALYNKADFLCLVAVNTGTSLVLSSLLSVLVFAGMQMFSKQLGSTEWLTILGGFLGSVLFICSLTVSYLWLSAFTSLIIALQDSSLCHALLKTAFWLWTSSAVVFCFQQNVASHLRFLWVIWFLVCM